MFCKNCGAQLPDGTKFCQLCGTSQQSETPIEYESYATPPVAPSPPPTVPNEPKKNNTNLIIICVVAVILIVAVVITGVILFKDKGNGSGDNTTTTTTISAESNSTNNLTPNISLPSFSIPVHSPLPSGQAPTQTPTVPSVQNPTVPSSQTPATLPTQTPTTPSTQKPTTPPTQTPVTPSTQPSVTRPSLSSAESVAKTYSRDIVTMNLTGAIEKEILGMSNFSSALDSYIAELTGMPSAKEAYKALSLALNENISNSRDFLVYLSDQDTYDNELRNEYGSNYTITATASNSRYLSKSDASSYVNAAKSNIGAVTSANSVSWSSISDYAAIDVAVKISGSKGSDTTYLSVYLAYINGSWKVLGVDDGSGVFLISTITLSSFID